MTRPLLVGAFSRPIDGNKVKQINTHEELQAVQVGDHVRRYDYIAQIDKETPLAVTLLPLRSRSDPLADAVVLELDLKPGQDGFAALETALALESPSEAVFTFWEACNAEPPAIVTGFVGVKGKGRRSEECTPIDGMRVNNRFAAPSLAEGQAVFHRYSAQIFVALMHFSLAGGFSSPNLSAVMRETAYLTSGSLEATYMRLIETTLFVLDVMNDMTIGTGRGWKSAIRVRLLHAQVRRKIKEKRGRVNEYSVETCGIPINQQDLMAVLGSFMIAPIWSLKRTGINLTPQELASYQTAWRHVGYYLGIDSDLLAQYYGRSFAAAESNFAFLAFDLFPSEVPLDGYKTSTYAILSAVANRPPRPSTVGYHCEYSRTLLGDRLADQLALPRGTWRDKRAVMVDCVTSWIMVHFGRYYRRGWEFERQSLFSDIMQVLIVWQLGRRRTLFAWRVEELRELKFSELEGEDPGVEFGEKVGKSIKRRWLSLLAEMVVVVGIGAVGAMGVAAAGIAVGLRM